MIDGKLMHNISCRKCKYRHPAELSCAQAAEYATAGKPHKGFNEYVSPRAGTAEALCQALRDIHEMCEGRQGDELVEHVKDIAAEALRDKNGSYV